MPLAHTNARGQIYFLHHKDVVLKNGREQRIYFFAREVKEGVLEAVPPGYLITENSQTGLPVLKKDRPSVPA